MAIALVGQAGGASFATSRTQNYSSTGGNTLVLFVAHQTDAITSVSDTAGNTWVLAKSNLVDDGAVGETVCSTYYVLDAAAITSVTVQVGATNRSLHTRISEWTGVGSLRDAASIYNSSFSSPTCSAPVAVQAGDLVVSGTAYFTPDATDDVTPPAGFTGWPALSISTVFSEAGYRLDSPTGTENASWTYSPGRRNGGVTASFAPTGGTPVQASASFTADGTLGIVGTAPTQASAVLSAESSMTAAAQAPAQAAAALAETGTMAASATAPAQAGVSFTADSSLTATAQAPAHAAAALTAESTMAASAAAPAQASAALIAESDMTANAQTPARATATFTAESDMTASARAPARAAAFWSGTGTMTATAGAVRAALSFTANATMTAAARVRSLASAAFTATGELIATARARAQAAAQFSGEGTFTIAVSEPVPEHPEKLGLESLPDTHGLTHVSRQRTMTALTDTLGLESLED